MHLSDLSRETFVQYFGGLYEQSTWILERSYRAGLNEDHDDPDRLFYRFEQVFKGGTEQERLAVLKSYPDLLGKGAQAGLISRESLAEHASVGLDLCSPDQIERFNDLNRLYWARFDFPFVMLLSGCSPDEILNSFSERLRNPRDVELKIAFAEVQKIARSRLDKLVHYQAPLAIPVNLVGRLSAGGHEHADAAGRSKTSDISTEQMRDPDYFPGYALGLPLGIQNVLAMFVGNITPAIMVAGAVGFGVGSSDPSSMAYMIQMSLFFAGVATLIQTIGIGPAGARLPLVEGAALVNVPVMILIATEFGMAALMGGVVMGGVCHFFLGMLTGHVRRWFPPLVTGLIVLMIGLALIKTGIQYAAGGLQTAGTAEYGSLEQWALALVVIVVTLIMRFFTRGLLSGSAVLLGLLAGYGLALYRGMINFDAVYEADWFALPNPLHFGIEYNFAAVTGMCLMAFVSVIATLGNISGITLVGADRQATDQELAGGAMATGLGNLVGGVFGALPNASLSQNVGLIFMTRLMSRHVVTLGALVLIVCGLIPVLSSTVQTMPIAVLGGAVIVMAGMLTAGGVKMLMSVDWDRRNMMIFGIALTVGLGLQLEPDALQHLPATARVLMTSGLLPAALIAIMLNQLLPQNRSEGEQPATVAAASQG